MKQNKSLLIGLTGGSGCGKTTVSNILKRYGAYIIDADLISHKIIEKNSIAYFELINHFGDNILDYEKNIDRKLLGSIVFSDKNELEFLEKVTHKHIIKEINNKIEIIKKSDKYKYIVVDAPLLIQTNLHKLMDTIWLVFAEKEQQIKRLIKRDNLSRDIIEKRLKNQMKFEDMKPFANFIIDNSKEIDLEKIILEQLNKEYE